VLQFVPDNWDPGCPLNYQLRSLPYENIFCPHPLKGCY
jgi:hypothetical protein